jgi:TRAP-type C4-dicarboxylate transport system permease small subunit
MSNETGQTGETGRKGILDRLEWAALVFAGVSLIGVVAVQAWQVFARYVLNDSPSWTEPMALVFIANTAMLGAAVAARRESHFGFPVLADSAPWPIRQACRAISRLAMLALGAGLSWFGFVLMADAWNVPMAGAALPTGLRFAPVTLGGAVIALFAGERLVRGLAEKREAAVEPAPLAETV